VLAVGERPQTSAPSSTMPFATVDAYLHEAGEWLKQLNSE
jgi:hypothetical protein